MISNYVRDNSFFQSLSESNSDISYKDFDKELNDFVNYTNRKVVTAINNIGANNYNGVIGNNNYILKNIGNGKVVFDSLKDSNFKDNSIGLEKIDFIKPYSLVFVNNKYNITFYNIVLNNHNTGGIFGGFSNSYEDQYNLYEEVYKKLTAAQLKLSQLYNVREQYPIEYQQQYIETDSLNKYLTNIYNTMGTLYNNSYDIQYGKGLKIKGNNFYDKQILTSNIEANTIDSWHINPDGQTYLINNVIVDIRHIVNKSITVDKFALYGITYDKLHPDIKNFREKLDTYLFYENNSITADKIKNNSFDFRLISTNLAKFGYGILHKNVIPVNSVPIAKPDQYAGETIDTYKLCVYSIANAYQLNTYTNPQPDQVYVNPEYIKQYNLYEEVYKKLTAAQAVLEQYRICCNYRGVYLYTEQDALNSRYQFISDKAFHIKAAKAYQQQYIETNNLNKYLINIYNTLGTIPKNIYTPVEPTIYQKLEAVPNTKSYLKHSDQQVIKSMHLKDGMFNILNIPNRITYNNVPSEKFINKYCLSPELRTKLGLVI